jgi:excisionase family DNA binding protein
MSPAIDLLREPTTLLPGDAPAAPAEISEALGAGRPVQLTGAVAAVVQQMLTALAGGRAVVVAVPDTSLGTQEAADLLGISRPTLVKLLDHGTIPSERPGSHRRVRLADVLAYRDSQRRRRQALADIAEDSQAAGLYDIPTSDYLDALREVRGTR